MAQDLLRYDRMVEEALRSVVRRTLQIVSRDGLPGGHHFYLTFRTDHPQTIIPDYLRARYPREMTIVLQYQYYGLDVQEERFEVTLSFNNVPERLIIPYAAITVFADPSVNFGLQFETLETDRALPAPAEDGEEVPETDARPDRRPPPAGGEVVSLDQFRKK